MYYQPLPIRACTNKNHDYRFCSSTHFCSFARPPHLHHSFFYNAKHFLDNHRNTMFPFSFWTSTSEFESRLQSTEAKLLEFVQRNNNDIEVKAFDTSIPRSAVPCLEPAKAEEDETLKIHCVQAVSNGFKNGTLENENPPLPLVNLHGYMNAGAYFYRNLEGLCSFFPSVYAVDMLGWGLSSRPSWNEVKDNGSVQSAEDFFVESLEAWRSMVRSLKQPLIDWIVFVMICHSSH